MEQYPASPVARNGLSALAKPAPSPGTALSETDRVPSPPYARRQRLHIAVGRHGNAVSFWRTLRIWPVAAVRWCLSERASLELGNRQQTARSVRVLGDAFGLIGRDRIVDASAASYGGAISPENTCQPVTQDTELSG
jgi:hypothetical protein